MRGGGFFVETMVADLLERLDMVSRNFTQALVIGAEPQLIDALNSRGIQMTVCDPSPRRAGHAVDEDRLDFDAAEFDLVLSSGTLDTIADLPGALVLMRRALKPDGLLLANFAAAPSLNALRLAVSTVDARHGHAVARFHPQVDVRSAGDLLVRAGFALPVADLDTIDVAYSGLDRLLTDLREAAATNVLAKRYPVTRHWLAEVATAFEAQSDEGRTHETLSYITLTAWAPAPGQPQPARRGSGSASLSEALRRRDD